MLIVWSQEGKIMPGFYFDVVERAQGVIDRFGQECFMGEIEGYIWHVEQFERYLEEVSDTRS